MTTNTKETLLRAQRNEITEHYVYSRLSEMIGDRDNARVLDHLSKDELQHYRLWHSHTREEVPPSRFRIWWYVLLARLFGLTFGMRLMESGEAKAKLAYADLGRTLPAAARVAHDEDAHERELIGMIDEERLRYVGSIVLGLNDALVELTGTLAGLTFALQNTKLIAMAGLITGVAASLSMAASEYLSTKSEERGQSPLKASLYTGSTYVLAVTLLILPYLLTTSFYAALGLTIVVALLLILVFTFYVSVAKGLDLRSRFFEMAGISLAVAALTFVIGYLVRQLLGVEI